MLSSFADPLGPDWTDTLAALDAATLADELGPLTIEALHPWHRELAEAVDELHRAAGRALSWGTGDPIVALLRALASLARSSPTATSPAAAVLAAVLSLTSCPP